MSDEWDVIGFVVSSRYRIEVLRRLEEGPATPSRIAEDTDISIAHISRALSNLQRHSLVELLVPETRKKGRIYGMTDHGKEIWKHMQAENLV